MEARLGHDFSSVRIHANAETSVSTKALNARAYAVGNHIVFAAGQYRPQTWQGNRLIAHELTHVMQQSALHAPVLQPQRKQRVIAGPRRVVVWVRWTDDRVDFYHRVVAAVARRATVSEASLWVVMNAPSHGLHARLTRTDSLREGQRISLIADLVVDPDAIAEVIQASLETTAGPKSGEAAQGAPTTSTATRLVNEPSPDETTEQRLRRQADTTARLFSEVVEDADREGYSGVVFTIEHTGGEISPGMQKLEPKQPRPSGTTPLRADTAYHQYLRHHLEWVLMGGTGHYRIVFGRDRRGVMQRISYETVEPVQAGTGQGYDPDIPNRREIYAKIFEQAGEELKEAGIMLAGFTLEQLVLWITGGVFLRAIGLLGSAAARAFPHLRRAVQLRRNGSIARAVNELGEAEAAEFARLMDAANKGRPSGAERARLDELMRRVETALATELPSLRVLSRIKDNSRLVREAENLSDSAQREVNNLLEQFLAGNPSPGIGTRHLEGGIFYLRGREGGRIFLRESAEGYLEILGKSDKHNESAVIEAILRTFQ